jgi:streptogramin lyase
MKKTSLLILSIAIVVFAFFLPAIGVAAKGKPVITRHDAVYMQNAVHFTVQWQSPNPVAKVSISAGSERKEVAVDEYDNRRNPSGYEGEVTVIANLTPGMSEAVSYVVQLEDDLRQRSDLATGKLTPPKAAKMEDDNWGKPAPLIGQQPQEQKSDVIDKLLGVMERHDTPPFLDEIKVNRISAAKVSFSSKANDDKGLREIKFRILDPTGNLVKEQTLSGLGRVWDGSTDVFELSQGNYTVKAQAIDTGGNASQERSTAFAITGEAVAAPGALTVTMTPQTVLDAGAQWRVDGGDWQKSGASVAGLTAGPHAVEFSDVAGWVKPGNQTVTMEAGKQGAAAGVYGQGSGSLAVAIQPQPLVDIARWRVDNGEWQKSGATVAGLAAGAHVIEFSDAAGWTKPANQNIQIENGKAASAVGMYTQTVGGLTVTITPQAALEAGGQWRVDNGAWQKSGAALASVAAGPHAIDFSDAAGWVKPSNLTVTVETGKTAAASAGYARIYTTNKDFDEGTLVGLEHQTVSDQLQLSKTSTTLPFIWVPNSNDGTISKVDSRTGAELGRYFTGPNSGGSPSRTTVDLKGNCWVGNRNTGTVVKVGLMENGQCVDRNGNGTIETSTGSNALAWGQDECVLLEVALSKGKEGTFRPGAANVPYDGAPGPRGIAIDANNNLWAGTYGTYIYYYIDGAGGAILKKIDVSSAGHMAYGAVVDAAGILWSADLNRSSVLRLDTKAGSFKAIPLGQQAYGISLDKKNHLFIAGWCSNSLARVNTATDQIEWLKPTGDSCSRGVAVTNDGDVWVANSSSNTVSRWSNDGQKKTTIPVGNHPTGVATDAEGKVWVVNYGDNSIKRIDPATNKVDLEKAVGGPHYGYSDMTGIVARTMTTKIGNWTALLDAKADNTKWSTVTWNGSEPQGTAIKVKVRSSKDKQTWSAWEDAQKGAALKATPDARYLQAETTMQVLSGEASPVLSDLTIKVQ